MTIASTSPGKANMMSTPRISQASVLPPKNPAAMPKMAPISKAMKTETMPTCNETRAPKTMREKVSRPSSSVPIRFCQLGGRRRLLSCASGSYGAISGAAMATMTVSSTTAAPTMPIGLRQRSGSRHQGRAGRPTRPSVSASVAPLIPA